MLDHLLFGQSVGLLGKVFKAKQHEHKPLGAECQSDSAQAEDERHYLGF